MTEKPSRRSILKGVAATGTAGTGIAAFGGQAAAQQDVTLNANQLFSSGLVVVQGVNVQDVIDVDDVTINILNNSNIDVAIQDIDVLNDSVIKILSDVNITDTLNNNVVTVQLLSGGTTLTDTVRVPDNLTG